MVPRLDTADQVREAVGYLRYPPAGGRGVALRTRGAGLGSRGHGQVGEVNERTLGIIQIESATAVAEVDHIAAIDGVDVLFVGPTDLSHSLGVPGQFADPTYLAALDTVVAACARHGKSAGILLYDPAVDRPARRAGVPVHRPRRGRLVRGERREGDARRRRSRLTVTRRRRGPRASAVPPRPARSGRSPRPR